MGKSKDISWEKLITRYFLKTFSGFLALTALLFVVLVPIYKETMKSIRNTSISALQKDLEASFREIDQKIIRLVQQSQLIAREPSVVTATGVIDIEERFPQYCYTLLQAKKRIANFFLQDEFVMNAYILSELNDVFLSGSIANIDRKTIYGSFYQIEGYQYEDWISKTLSGAISYFFLPQANANWIFDLSQVSNQKPTLHLVVPISTASSKSQKAVVYLLSVEALYAKLTRDRFSNEDFIYLLDPQGTMIASQNYNGEAILMTAPVTVQPVDGNDMTFIQHTSSETGLTVVMGVSNAYFDAQLLSTKRALLLVAAAVLIMVLFLSIFISYRQSRPMSHTMEMMHRVNPDTGTRDAYDYITRTVSNLDLQRKHYAEEIKTMGMVLRASYLERLFSGKILTREDIEQCQKTLELYESCFCCIYTQVHCEKGEITESLDMAAHVLNLLEEEMRRSGYRCLSQNNEPNTVVLLICTAQESDILLPELTRILEQCVSSLRKNFNIRITVGVGKIVSTLEAIGWSYKYAKSAIRMADEQHPVQQFIRRVDAPEVLMSIHRLQKLADLINAGESSDALNFLQELAEKTSADSILTEDEFCQIYYSIRNILMDTAHMLVSQKEDLQFPDLKMNLPVRDQILAFSQTVFMLCNRAQSRYLQASVQKQHRILTYIQENFSSSTLCALSIAEEFHVAEKYVFNVVKSGTGKSLGDYVEELRLKQAEKLLMENADINGIPEQIGYNSINTFYKAFKRVYHTSPGKWRAAFLDCQGRTPPH